MMLLKAYLICLLWGYLTARSFAWYSVPELKPGRNHGDKSQGGFGPWPVVSLGHQPIRYCFSNERSLKNLEAIVDEAIERWRPATKQAGVSTLSFELAEQTQKICSTSGVFTHALHITDDTKDGDDHHNWYEAETQSMTGYDYRSAEAGRNELRFCELKPDKVEQTRERAVVRMMHELGHALGLAHEHARPDRAKYVKFFPTNLEGYDQAKLEGDVRFDVHDIFGGLEPEPYDAERMEMITSTELPARMYLPSAMAYLTGDEMDPKGGDRWIYYRYSEKFDSESIMIYPGDTNSHVHNPVSVKDWPMTLRQPVQGSKKIWMGGSSDPKAARISEGDIARVAQLYPLPDGKSTEAQNLARWAPAKQQRWQDVTYDPLLGPPKNKLRPLKAHGFGDSDTESER